MPKRTCVLGLHPSSRGFGWVLFGDALSLDDWGTVDIRKDRNVVALTRIEALLDKHTPDVLAMERHDADVARRSQRIRKLYTAVAKCAEKREINVLHYSRAQISSSAYLKGTRTRREVAAAVADCVSVLRRHLPTRQHIWVGERGSMALFCAAACALTYFGSVLTESGPEPALKR